MENELYELIQKLTSLQYSIGESEMHFKRLQYAYHQAMDAVKKYAPEDVYNECRKNLDD